MSAGVVAAPRVAAPPRQVTLLGRDLKLFLPTRGDPRVKLFVIIVAIQTVGQVGLHFKVSIAQILITMGVCLVIEEAMFIWRDGIIAWPASALQSGNSIALLLRASGTQHGDWWSLNGIQYFIIASAIALFSKYLIRPGGKHVFNPSNIAIVWVLLVGGVRFVFPQYLWWGPLNVPVTIALFVILAGALWLLRRPVGMLPMAASFLVPFYGLVAIFAATGRTFIAEWHHGPITGFNYWLDICFSPEVFVFVFFMMSDPRTAPRPQLGRMIYGASVAVIAALLLFPQSTEFGVKLGILSALTFVCAFVPLIEWGVRRIQAKPGDPARAPIDRDALFTRLRRGATKPAVIAAAILAIAAPLATTAIINDRTAREVEMGIINPQ